MIYTGGGAITDYFLVGKISPSTLRYIKVLSDLILYFGSLDNLRICEIGVGYGGQARAINAIFTPKSYDFVDLNPALNLTKKYLSHYPEIKAELNFITMENLQLKSYDLFISNYAFSELNREIQDLYAHHLIANAQKGYITYNDISPQELRSYKIEEYPKLIGKEIQILEEIPNSHIYNKIIIW